MIFLFLTLLIILSIYLPWFDLTKTLSSGDWPYLYPENIASFKFTTESPFLWLEPYYQITAKLGVQIFSLSWELTEKIFWFYLFLIISIISSCLFLKCLTKVLGIDKNSLFFISIGSLIFTTNTYILMLVGGGQMGVAMAYSLTPLVILGFFKFIDFTGSSDINFQFLWVSLVLSVQLMFDPRIFLLTIITGIIYFGFTSFLSKGFDYSLLKRVLLVLGIAFLLNLFWILPNFGYLSTEYKTAVNAISANFLSFATFSNSISLLHPNWPENTFGKVGFMKPEFLILPILAYSSLLFLNSKVKTQNSKMQVKSKKFENNLTIKQFNNRVIIFFAFLGLIGVFLAKGTNPPFGELYVWLSNIPGFMIFRDPTKFYTMVVVSYMVLLPFSILSIYFWFNSKFKIKNLLVILFIGYWLFLVRPAVFGQLTGTFKPHEVPEEYINLKDFLSAQPEFTKTLWVPGIERFGFNSRIKPAISSMEIFGVSSMSEVLDKFDKPEVKKQIIDEEVRYVIVPYDYLKEIFLTDRKYDNRLYIQAINKLKDVYWLRAVVNNNFGRIKVFEVIY